MLACVHQYLLINPETRARGDNGHVTGSQRLYNSDATLGRMFSESDC